MLNYNTLRYRSEWQLSPIRLNQSFPSAAVVHGSDVFSIAPADCTYIPVCRTSLVASFFLFVCFQFVFVHLFVSYILRQEQGLQS